MRKMKGWAPGSFVKPTLIELDSIAELQKEVFGLVLHVVRFQRSNLVALVDQINAAGYDLTLGIPHALMKLSPRWATCTLTAQYGRCGGRRTAVWR